jgi:hypothetical protein
MGVANHGERWWGAGGRPVPRRWVVPDGYRPNRDTLSNAPFDFSARMHGLIADVCTRCPAFAHVNPTALGVTFTPSRNRSRYGLQARVTPLRFAAGADRRTFRGREYRIQRFVLNGAELLYLVTFCLPRFLDRPFEDKLTTIFHELFHIGPAFDGDLRRLGGRYAYHSRSKCAYDDHAGNLAKEYRTTHPDPDAFAFLRFGYRDLWHAYGGVHGVVLPKPKLLPVGEPLPFAARRPG